MAREISILQRPIGRAFARISLVYEGALALAETRSHCAPTNHARPWQHSSREELRGENSEERLARQILRRPDDIYILDQTSYARARGGIYAIAIVCSSRERRSYTSEIQTLDSDIWRICERLIKLPIQAISCV